MAEEYPKTYADPPRFISQFYQSMREENPKIERVRQAMSKRLSTETVTQLQWGAFWMKYGMPVFQLTEDLLAALTLTDAAGVHRDDVNPPFDSMLVTVPRGFWYLQHEGAQPEILHGDVPEEGATPLRSIQMHRYRWEKNPEADALVMMSIGESGLVLWDNTALPEGDLTPWFDLGFSEGDGYNLRRKEVTDAEQAIQRQIRRLWVNLSLYIAEKGRGKRVGRLSPKKRKAGRRKAPVMQPSTWIVGQDIKIGKEAVEAAKGCHTRAGYKVAVRTVVRGHQKMQPYGPQNSLRKRIWVKPYVKGPKDGPKVAHNYQVEGG